MQYELLVQISCTFCMGTRLARDGHTPRFDGNCVADARLCLLHGTLKLIHEDSKLSKATGKLADK